MTNDEKWRLESISIRSFRGVAGEQALNFGGRSALLYGNNGVGKSTMALALQWTLYGRFPGGVLPNIGFKNFLAPVSGAKSASCGEVLFRRAGRTLTVNRDEAADTFKVAVGSKILEDKAAEDTRDSTLGLDMDAFARTVLLQQSRVRGLLLDELKDRNHAIDMLLGVEAAQDLVGILKDKPFRDAAAGWRSSAMSAKQRHGAQAEILKRQLEEAVERARESGFLNKDLNWTALSTHLTKLIAAVRDLATKHEVRLLSSVVPSSPAEAQRFSAKVAKDLLQIQLKAKSQVRLEQEKTRSEKIQGFLAAWDQALRDRDKADKMVLEAEAPFASSVSPESVLEHADAEIEKQDEVLRNHGQMHKLLVDARSALAVQRGSTCPVCTHAVDAARLDKDLESRIRSLSSGELVEGRKVLDGLKRSRAEIKANLVRFAEQKASRSLAQKQLDKLSEQIATFVGAHAISESKVRQRLLENAKNSTDACEALGKDVASLANDIVTIATRAADLEGSLLTVILKREEILLHQKEEQKIQRDHAGSEKKAASMEGVGTSLERIRLALLSAKDQLASDRLARARPRALELYERLVRHPKFSSFEITTIPRARRVDYSFEVSVKGNSSTAREAKLVLSDGQITATAVGIFVGLAESAAHGMDLLFIDDPTQNLDLPCKEAMAKLMVEMAGRKQIVLSTHDEDFVSYLKEHGFDKKASIFHIESWNGNPKVVSGSKSS